MKDVFKRLLKFRPRLLPSGIGALLSIGITLFLLISGRADTLPLLPVCLIYAAAFAFLCLNVWALVRWLQNADPRQQIDDRLHSHALSARLVDDHVYRIQMTGYATLILNVLMALSKAAAGWYYASEWLIVLAGYYAVLCIAKFWVLRRTRRAAREADEAAKLRREWQTYRFCGLMLIALTTVLQGVVIKIVKDGSRFTYPGMLIFVVALYDFYCLISAILYMVRTRKKHTPATVAVKTISLATSLVAMLSLQTAMFASFGAREGTDTGFQQMMNLITGTAVCVLLLGMGIVMVVRSARKLTGQT